MFELRKHNDLECLTDMFDSRRHHNINKLGIFFCQLCQGKNKVILK